MIVSTEGEIFFSPFSISALDQLPKSPQNAPQNTRTSLNKFDQD